MNRLVPSLMLVLVIVLMSPVGAHSQQRGGGFSAAVDQAVGRLDYHALVIGINSYQSGIPKLDTSVNDARAVKDLLVGKYGFAPQNVIELYDGAATRSNIIRTLRELSISLDENDALFVYFAGHGIEDIATSTGYWIPADATPNAYETYVSNADIRTYLRAIKARHIFLVSDSCFSGTLLAQRAMPGEIDERFYARKAASRSRVVLTSGGNEPVMDAGKSGHSVFCYFFLKTLQDYEKPYLIPTQIFAEVGPLVGNNAPQTPQWGNLREAMDEGGELVFVNRQYQAPANLSFSANKISAVYLEGRFIGNTPIASYEVRPGTYSYKIACAEYGAEKTGTAIARAGESCPINEQFAPPAQQSPGYLSVATKPWVQIFIDGKLYGYSPKAEIALPAGTHTVRLFNAEAGMDRTLTIDVISGRHVKIGPNVQSINQ